MKVLRRAGKLKDGLLEDLPELAESRAEGGSQSDNDIKGSVNDEPVILGRASIDLLLLFLVTEILLAGVRSGNEEANDGDNLLENAILGNKDSRTAGLECGGNVAVDVGDDGSVEKLASCVKNECNNFCFEPESEVD